MRPTLLLLTVVGLSVACAPHTPAGAPTPAEASGATGGEPTPPPLTAEPEPQPLAPPGLAAANGWMPIHSSRVPDFLREHPTFDGRGVLVAILDSGVDPTVPGLVRTSTNEPKVIDIRDFSGEGRIELAPVALRGDSVVVGSRVVLGAGRLRGFSTGGPSYAGALLETLLGTPAAADVNGNQVVGDTLLVVVTRASDGWILLADTDGDGTLANESPVRDYRVAQETFGWHAEGRASPMAIAVNMEEASRAGGPPRLDLVFDNSGHGTHVAGIAAGNDLYDIPGFDGVAPGADLLALKISNDARGGISVTGSILQAADYAIRVARGRRQPLVINLSFGVGNETEGAARIDVLLDSLLAANPDVVMTVSAGNDGPGLSTIGFPGSARRVLSVGATYPGVFLPPTEQGEVRADLLAFFSARGGEVGRPDLVAPGLAYSTTPRWNMGDEVKSGTSMAAPYVAGLAANLLSAALASGDTADAGVIRRALTLGTRPITPGTWIDQGAGLPDLPTAWDILVGAPDLREPPVEVRTEFGDAAMVVAVAGAPRPAGVVFTVTAPPGRKGEYRLTAKDNTVLFPATIALGDEPTQVPVLVAWDSLGSEVRTSVIEGWRVSGGGSRPSFRLLVTAGVAAPLAADTLHFEMEPGGLRRFLVKSDSGRAFRVSLSERAGGPLLLFLHEPGGMPSRNGPVSASGSDGPSAILEVDGRDAQEGSYEIVALAGPATDAEAVLVIDPAPVRVSATRDGDSLTVNLRSVQSSGATGTVVLELTGAERGQAVSSRGSRDVRIPFRLPPWASRLTVEVKMDREQWPVFTDFGLTLEGSRGEVVAASPLNYAVGRLDTEITDDLHGKDVEIVLSPAFADPGAADLWAAGVTIRLYGGDPGPRTDAEPFSLVSNESITIRKALPTVPWPLGDAFDPLGDLIVTVAGSTWRTETRLGPRLPPIMR